MDDNYNEKNKMIEDEWWDDHTKYEHFERFEKEIRTMMLGSNLNADNLDFLEYAYMINSLFVFVVKDKFEENNQIFLDNTKNDFYNFLEYYSKKFNKDIYFLKKFADFYIFN